MSKTFTWRMANATMALAIAIMPARRCPDWRDAMLAEFLHLANPAKALAFATGCLRASFVERNYAMSIPQRLLYFAGIAIPASLAAVAFWSASNLASIDSFLMGLFIALGALYAGVAGWATLRSHHALITAASAILALCVALFFVLTLPVSWEQKAMYRALVTESMVIWLVMLGVGVALRRLSSPQTEKA